MGRGAPAGVDGQVLVDELQVVASVRVARPVRGGKGGRGDGSDFR